MTPDELDGLLEQVGRVPVADPDPSFAAALEERLVAEHATTDVAHRGRRAWIGRSLLAAAAIVAVVAVATVAVPGGDTPVTLANTSDARVALPDGTIAEADAGLELPDGTVVTAGDEPVIIDGVTVAPGDSVRIVDGRVEPVADRDGDVAAPGDGRDEPDRPGDTSSTTVAAGPGPTVVGPAPAPTDRPDQPSSTTTTSTTRPPTTTTTVAPRPAELDLTTRRADRRVGLAWSRFAGDSFARYVVVRSVSTGDGPPPGLTGPKSGEQVFSSTDPAVREHVDALPPGVTHAAYRVFALDAQGRVLAQSPSRRA